MTETSPLYVAEIEQQVLGNILNNNQLADAIGGIRPDYFHDGAHRAIMEAIAEQIEAGGEATAVSVSFRLKSSEAVEALGGTQYIARLAATSTRSGYEQVALELRNLWARREMSTHLREGLASIERFDPFQSPEKALSQIEGAVAAVTAVASQKPLVSSALAGMTGALQMAMDAQNAGGVVGTPSGLRDLDELIGGLGPGDFITLAGRPSMGKTALALAIAWNVARSDRGVLFASLEMPKEQIWNRFFSSALSENGEEVPYFAIRTGRAEVNASLAGIIREHQSMPFLTAEKEARSIPRLRAAARRASAQFAEWGMPFGLIVVDYLQLLEDPTARSDYQRVSNASNAMKSMAIDLGVPVIALSQLNRGVEMRDPPVPTMSDLRESGKIEEDSDVVGLIYREAYYITKALERDDLDIETEADLSARLTQVKHRCKIFVAKARGGPTGAVSVGYRPELNRVWSLG